MFEYNATTDELTIIASIRPLTRRCSPKILAVSKTRGNSVGRRFLVREAVRRSFLAGSEKQFITTTKRTRHQAQMAVEGLVPDTFLTAKPSGDSPHYKPYLFN